MKTKIEPLYLICHNNELVDINVYHLRDKTYKVKDNNTKLSFCYTLDKMDVQTVLNSDLLNDKRYYLKLIRKGIIEKSTEKKDSFYLNLLITQISDIIKHIKDSYELK